MRSQKDAGGTMKKSHKSSPRRIPSEDLKMIELVQQNHTKRLYHTLSGIDRLIASRIVSPPSLPGVSNERRATISQPEEGAVTLQCWWRRVKALRIYRSKLYDRFIEEDRIYRKKQAVMVDDTLAMLENIKLQQDLLKRRCFDEADRNLRKRSAYKIRKFFRRNSLKNVRVAGSNTHDAASDTASDDSEDAEQQQHSFEEEREGEPPHQHQDEEETLLAPPPPLPPSASSSPLLPPHSLHSDLSRTVQFAPIAAAPLSTTPPPPIIKSRQQRPLTLDVKDLDADPIIVGDSNEELYNITITPPSKARSPMPWSTARGEGGNDFYDVLFTPKVRQAFGDFEGEGQEEGWQKKGRDDSIYNVNLAMTGELVYGNEEEQEEEVVNNRVMEVVPYTDTAVTEKGRGQQVI